MNQNPPNRKTTLIQATRHTNCQASNEEISTQENLTEKLFLPEKRTFVDIKNTGFDKGSLHKPIKNFSTDRGNFYRGEVLEVIGTRKYGPMAALEIIFVNSKTNEKKFWTLHHRQHNYSQDLFEKIG
jgi:hypothetical protein